MVIWKNIAFIQFLSVIQRSNGLRDVKVKVSVILAVLSIGLSALAQESKHPNILIILADDLGYGDLLSYNPNSMVPTPNLDRLASEGIRLTRAYCPVAVCSPSRYALMTGRYPFRSWRKTGVMRNYERSMIDSSILTLPEMLQQVGYVTAGFGKWHLGTTFTTLDGELPAGYGQFRADDNGANLDLTRPVTDGPQDHGFDHWFGFSCASECWVMDEASVVAAIGHDLYTIEATPNKDHIEVIPLEEYLPFITDRASQFLDSAANNNDRPFFLYFAPYVPHIPLSVKQEFRGKTKAGLYGDYVHELDHYLGMLLRKLDTLGLTDNTVVLFASDNGSQFTMANNQMDLSKATNQPSSPVQASGTDRMHHPNWPLRGTKWSIYEGGVRTPFIARWPGRFPAGETRHQLFGLNDVMATLAEIINFSRIQTDQLDSYNLLPVLDGSGAGSREEIVVQSSGKVYALIRGKWKYIFKGWDNAWSDGDPVDELYDLSTDESEEKDLRENHPDIARYMKERLEEILRNHVNLQK